MKASATSERNDVILPSGVQPPPAAPTQSGPPDTEMPDTEMPETELAETELADTELNGIAAPRLARPSPSAAFRAGVAKPDATDSAAKKPAPPKAAGVKPPSSPATAKPAAREKAPGPASPEAADVLTAADVADAPTDSDAAAEHGLERPQTEGQGTVATAPDPAAPAVNSEETQTVQNSTPPAAEAAEAKPQDAKIQDVKTAEAKTADPKMGEARPMNGPQGARAMAPVRPLAKEENFAEGDYVVYPTHGVGKVEKIAVEDIAGHRLELIHITFEENRMTLRVPVAKARTAGLRKLATQAKFDEALAVLRGRARIKRTMWSRRAQEYEAKINSGDPIAIAEVVRDLHRNAGQPDQSFSERQIYEFAMDRLAAELAALDATDKVTAAAKLVNFLKAA